MLLRSVLSFICLFSWLLIEAQVTLESDPLAASFFAEKIQADGLRQHIERLASPEFEGRETGTPGLDKAAQYIIQDFKSHGILSPTGIRYRQNVTFAWVKWEEATIEVNGREFEHMKDFLCLPRESSNRPKLETNDIVFLGYGIDDPNYSDYQRANAKGKVVMIYPGEPRDADSLSRISGTPEASTWSSDFERKLEAATQAGVQTLLVVDPNIVQRIQNNRNAINQTLTFELPNPKSRPNVLWISSDIAEEIIGKKRNSFIKNRRRITNTGRGRPLHLKCTTTIRQHLSRNALLSQNVLALIEGTDPKLKEEVVVISAHYDHLGKRGPSLYPGADDNASGTAAVLEIMETLQKASKENEGPRRSVLAILFTGEEKGLLGSAYYAEQPVIPLENTVVDVNIDMIGRVDEKHGSSDQYIYVIGSDRLSSTLHHINEQTN
nr:M28 family peptidase [Saprospiraceae bacterium]